VGANSLDELINQTIPSSIRLEHEIELPEALTKHQCAEHIAEIASKKELFTTYIGQGWDDTCTPAVNSLNCQIKKEYVLYNMLLCEISSTNNINFES
jgi:glycine cleavage system pyridoxal-binding protein P